MKRSQLCSNAVAKAATHKRERVAGFVWVRPLALLFIVAHSAQGGEGTTVDFNRDIRPILSNNCFKCHGPDEDARKADLRLDTSEGALADRGGYRAINPEEPAISALLLRITTADDAERMPPAESGLRLSADQIALLSRWIEQGAPFEQHWAFRPIRKYSMGAFLLDLEDPCKVIGRLARPLLSPNENEREGYVLNASFIVAARCCMGES